MDKTTANKERREAKKRGGIRGWGGEWRDWEQQTKGEGENTRSKGRGKGGKEMRSGRKEGDMREQKGE